MCVRVEGTTRDGYQLSLRDLFIFGEYSRRFYVLSSPRNILMVSHRHRTREILFVLSQRKNNARHLSRRFHITLLSYLLVSTTLYYINMHVMIHVLFVIIFVRPYDVYIIINARIHNSVFVLFIFRLLVARVHRPFDRNFFWRPLYIIR